jgi:glycine/D-amino acid oxidase-like deaminating enzyme
VETPATAPRPTPLWMDDAPAPVPATAPVQAAAPVKATAPLPPSVDVLIVGAGYTGLSAARETAGAGRSTLVLDAESAGAGCSSRNGGQVAYSIKPSYEILKARHGADLALRICEEAHRAVTDLRSLATEQGLDCDWRPRGGFYGAHTARHFAAMAAQAENQPRGLEQRVTVVPKSEQHREIDSDFYHGGCVYHDEASVNPRRLTLALLRRAIAAGAQLADHCPVAAIRAVRHGFEVQTARGIVASRRVLLATNGYSGPLSPWHQRRVIPIGSYQIATDRLGVDFVRSLIPQGRHISDTRRVVVYYRPSPDGERIIFGGRASLSERDPLVCVPRLRSMMTRVFPQLRSAAITHAWAGWVAYTFDTMPHLGQRDGLYYCMGYCGQGIPLATYYGKRIGQQIADLPEGRTELDGLAFPTRPYYFGAPWFLAPSVFVYRLMDSIGI